MGYTPRNPAGYGYAGPVYAGHQFCVSQFIYTEYADSRVSVFFETLTTGIQPDATNVQPETTINKPA